MVWMQVLNLLATIALNALANILPINGRTTGGVSDSVPVLFTPAGYVFSIWSVIYVGLLCFAVYQLLPARRGEELLQRVGYWFVVSCICNMVGLFLWHYERFPLTLVTMSGLLVSLLMLYVRLGIGVRWVSASEKLLVHLPFSICLGWISVATIANVSVVLYALEWNGFGLSPEIWTILVLVVGAALGIGMIVLRRDVAYPLVLVWAFLGILARHSGRAVLTVPSGGLAAVLLLATVFFRLRGAKGA